MLRNAKVKAYIDVGASFFYLLGKVKVWDCKVVGKCWHHSL